MAAYEGSFESVRNIEEKRERTKKAREQLLSKAKDEFEKAERRKEQRRLRGEDTWMLNDVNERLEELNQNSEKKKKKDKTHKKAKKEKKKKHKKEKSENNASSSDNSQDSEDEWVEANSCPSASTDKAWKIKNEDATRESDSVKRDEWMTLDFMSLKATSTAALRAEKQKEKTLEHERAEAVTKEKLQARELNPFWKDGGQGLPPEEGDVALVKKAVHVEDGGLSWLRKSYQRMKEQAERQNRNFEDIVAERYGSMEIFQNKLDAAEKTAMQNSSEDYGSRRDRWRKYPETESRKFVRPDDYRKEDRHTTSQKHDKYTHRERREHHADKPKWERRESDKTSSELERGRYTDSPVGEYADTKKDRNPLKHKFLKPSEDDDKKIHRSLVAPPTSSRITFLKPDEPDPSWRRTSSKGLGDEKHQFQIEDSHVKEMRAVEEMGSECIGAKDSLSSVDKPLPSPDTKPPIQILSEEEMNKLGAKIVKAELLGNMELAAKLRAQLEDARQAKYQHQVSSMKSSAKESEAKEDNDILLIKTDQSGRSWPVNAPANPMEPKGGRKKRQMVTTHVDKERVRYFHDDDNQSLQDLVKREKMGTAEDQNKLFMRMSSKVTFYILVLVKYPSIVQD
ncbi:Hypothetical predicted protein [Pelobates cultripes]|uniref:CWF19-like protein 2 n=1 Tax=Pelobates cultripes TaxID=61616 RepID=A0AAD1VP84_PELCU|nr:Hypothetical predicted protein [Pelobates cultripes]